MEPGCGADNGVVGTEMLEMVGGRQTFTASVGCVEAAGLLINCSSFFHGPEEGFVPRSPPNAAASELWKGPGPGAPPSNGKAMAQ